MTSFLTSPATAGEVETRSGEGEGDRVGTSPSPTSWEQPT